MKFARRIGFLLSLIPCCVVGILFVTLPITIASGIVWISTGKNVLLSWGLSEPATFIIEIPWFILGESNERPYSNRLF